MLPPSLLRLQVSAEALRTLFNSALSVQFAHMLMPGMDPVINVNMHPEVRARIAACKAQLLEASRHQVCLLSRAG